MESLLSYVTKAPIGVTALLERAMALVGKLRRGSECRYWLRVYELSLVLRRSGLRLANSVSTFSLGQPKFGFGLITEWS